AFLDFAVEVGAITKVAAAAQLEMARQALQALLPAQDEAQRGEDVVEVFLHGLGNVLAAKGAHVADWETKSVPLGFPLVCGWSALQQSDANGDSMTETWHPNGDCIGWLAGGDTLYMLPDATFACVNRLRTLSVDRLTLRKRLKETKALAAHDKKKLTKKVSHENGKIPVLALKADRVLFDFDMANGESEEE